MKRIFISAVIVAMVFGFSISAHAALLLRGTDTLGNRLIYDNDLGITLYDYTNAANTWQNQVSWADALSVTFGGNVYDDWRLPSTVDGANLYGTDGTTTVGYNITGSEMGHLYYTELGNLGYCGTSGNCPQTGWGLTNTNYFLNLQPYNFWSGTEYAANLNNAWRFGFGHGYQGVGDKGDSGLYALAVRPGDVSSVPEPGTMLLLGSGFVALAVFRKRFGRIHR